MDLDDIILNEISQTQKRQIHDSSYLRYSEYSNSQRQKAEWWLPGTGGNGEMGSCYLKAENFSLQDKKFWILVIGITM